jgi:hypothetical protein
VADMFSILSTAYTTVPTPSAASSAKYVPVDPTHYEGTWKGAYSTGEKFSFTISNVEGFRAKVKYQSGNGPIKYQDVLIRDNAFRLGDSKFLLKKVGHATIKTVVTDPATGHSTLNTAPADLQT